MKQDTQAIEKRVHEIVDVAPPMTPEQVEFIRRALAGAEDSP